MSTRAIEPPVAPVMVLSLIDQLCEFHSLPRKYRDDNRQHAFTIFLFPHRDDGVRIQISLTIYLK
jgi:hypothetical protein